VTVPKALTIAGSDSSGGAGIQADLKTFSALKVYGMSVITALTAQNTREVSDVLPVDANFVGSQLDAVMIDIPPDATKTGMLLTRPVIEIIAAKIQQHHVTKLVVDPVIVSKSGATLLQAGAREALCRSLLPLALMVTPNTEEAEVLTGTTVRTMADMEKAARLIHGMGPQCVLLKGGHLDGDAVDLFFDGIEISYLAEARLPSRDSHGTGCVLSAAITAHLASGRSVLESVYLGKAFVTEAIRRGLRIGGGRGPCDPLGLMN
jgi:hydroxymethylpyrimidine/phosphomethylpyrimidine kinase